MPLSSKSLEHKYLYEKFMVLMPGQIGRISAFKLLGIDRIDARSNLCI